MLGTSPYFDDRTQLQFPYILMVAPNLLLLQFHSLHWYITIGHHLFSFWKKRWYIHVLHVSFFSWSCYLLLFSKVQSPTFRWKTPRLKSILLLLLGGWLALLSAFALLLALGGLFLASRPAARVFFEVLGGSRYDVIWTWWIAATHLDS